MKKATQAQIIKFHALLNELGLMEHKKDIVSEFAQGKESTKDMSLEQMKQAIEHLEGMKTGAAPMKTKNDSLDRQRKKIIGFCREMRMETQRKGKTVADMPKIYSYIKEKGYLKKDFNDYNESEIPKLVWQIEKIKNDFAPKLEQATRAEWNVTNTETGETKKAKEFFNGNT